MSWRLIITKNTNPYYVTAADEAIAEARKAKKVTNTLHFYQRNPPSVSVGRSKKIKDDINLRECKKNNIAIVRRATGGGTIFTDKGCLIYSLVFDKNDLEISCPSEIFEIVCNSIVSGLEKQNINTAYKPPNDILLNGKKISGSAQIQKKDIILIHGTILIHTDLVLLQKVLKQTKKDYVSTVNLETKKPFQIHTMRELLIHEFESTLHTKFTRTSLSEYEKKLCDTLLETRYKKDIWTYGR
ncbi:MAG: biotin/lipoate A/B protein ligase family protein [Thermoplasmatota archaeon]